MANEITYISQLSFTKGNLTKSAGSIVAKRANMAGSNYVEQSLSVPTTAAAIPLGGITTPGWMSVTNNDPTNFLTILSSTGGAAVVKVLPGETQSFRLGAAAPAWKADTALVAADLLVIEA